MRGPSASTRTTSRRRCGPSCPAVSTEPMSTGTATKTCRKCGEAKSTSEFHKHANGKGGLHSECKECTKARVRAYYHANRERALARKAEYRRANRERLVAQNAEYYQTNRATIVAFRAANPHIRWEHRYRRRCRKYGLLEPVLVSFTYEDVVARYGPSCPTASTETDYTPRATGGNTAA